MIRPHMINAYLGEGAEFEGTLKFHGTIRIDGRLKGKILGDGTLIVGDGAVLESEVHVSYVDIYGEVQGDIVADQGIEIHAPGKVSGNLKAPAVVIEKGVFFEGTCQMPQAKEEVARRLAVIGPKTSKRDPLPSSDPEERSEGSI